MGITGAMPMNKDVKIIVSRIKLLFKRMNKTRYWLSVVNDPIDQQFNFFSLVNTKVNELGQSSYTVSKLISYPI